MKSRTSSLMIAASVVLSCVIASVTIHAGFVATFLPGECPQCHLPTLFEYDGADWPHKPEDAPAFKCIKCGSNWWQMELDNHAERPSMWGALVAELMGETNSGPLEIGQLKHDPRGDGSDVPR